MRLGFTGTRSIFPDQVANVHAFLAKETPGFDEFTTGACVGFDALAANWLLDNRPEATHRLVVPANRAQVDKGVISRFESADAANVVIEYMPEGTDYRDRNARILDHSDELLAVAEYAENDGHSLRSGTWMTVRMARNRVIPVRELVLAYVL